MIDLKQDELVPLGDVPDLPVIRRLRRRKRRGHNTYAKLNPSTVFRWATRGVRGHRLEVIAVGGLKCTTATALEEFFRRCGGGMGEPDGAPPTQAARRRARQNREADTALAAEGV